MAAASGIDTHDYIVVGAGSAGCVLANRLTADGRHRVLLLEAGGHDRHLWIHIPLGYGKLFADARVNWLYKTEPEPELDNRQVIQPRGKVLGGSSSINGLLYLRGQPADYDHWRQLGNTGWSFDDVLPYFRRAEHQERGEDALHGVGGPLAVSNVCEPHPLCEAFIEAAQQAGYPRNDDFNGPTQEGAGYFQLTAKQRPALVHGGRLPEGGAAAVQSHDRDQGAGEPHPVRGPPRDRHRIPPRRPNACRPRPPRGDSRGRRLQLAATAAALGRRACGAAAFAWHRRGRRYAWRRRRSAGPSPGPHPVSLHRTDHHERRDQQLAPPHSAPACATRCSRKGLLAIGAGYAGGFFRTSEQVATPDVQVHFIIFSGETSGAALHPFPGFIASICQLRPESRGFVRIKSADPAQAPAIQPRYLSSEFDRDTMVAGLKLLRGIMGQPAMQHYIAEERVPGPQGDERCRPSGLRAVGGDDGVPPDQHLPHGAGRNGGGR